MISHPVLRLPGVLLDYSRELAGSGRCAHRGRELREAGLRVMGLMGIEIGESVRQLPLLNPWF